MSKTPTLPHQGRLAEEGVQQHRKKALNGVWLGATLALVNRASSFVSQLVAGWLLSPEDYGLVAMATGLSAISSIIRGAGITRFLVHRHDEFAQLARPSFWFSLCCNSLTAAVYVAAAGFMTWRGEPPLLIPVISCIGLSMLLRTSVAVRRAHMQAKLEFRGLFEIDRYVLFLQHGLTIAFALVGFGPLSLVLPNVVCALYEHLALRRRVGPLPDHGNTVRLFGEVFRSVRWIMLGAACMAISQQGDYFIVGLGFPKDLAGAYYFGFVAAASFSRMFTSSLGSVMAALLSRHQDDPSELRRLTIRAQSELGLLLSVLSLGLALATPAAFHYFWQGKYDDAILPALAVLIALPVRSISPVHESLIEATGRWKMRAGVFAVDATGTLLATAIGVNFGSMMSLCIAVTLYRLAWGIVLLAHSGFLLDVGLAHVPKRVVPTFVGFLAMAGLAWKLATHIGGDPHSLLVGTLAVSAYLVMSTIVLLVAFPERTRWLLQAMRTSRSST